MIIRIVEEGQFQVPGTLLDELNEVDNHIVTGVSKEDRIAFQQAFDRLLDLVRRRGQRLAFDDLRPSDVIFPAAHTTFEEARHIFVGEGLVPG